MEIRNIIILSLLLYSCQKENPKSEIENFSHKTEMEDNYQPFPVVVREGKAVLRVRDYLLSQGIFIDSMYVNMSYSDSLCHVPASTITNSINACFIILNIQHKTNYDYFNRIDRENARIMQDKKESDWIPLLVPSSPEFLKREILIHYYLKEDSIADIPTL
jgi:hypothetical protein